MAALTKNFDRITGRFACVYGGVRTEERTHGYCTESAGVISANPEDATLWLMLADQLQEEGNPAHIVIRAAFEADFVPPEGFTGELRRGGRYMENGQHYYEGVNVSWDAERKGWESGNEFDCGSGFVLHYWNGNGSSYRFIDAAEVRHLLAGVGRRTNWCDVVAEGTVKPVYRVVPIGTKVNVSKNVKGVLKTVNANYAINENIPVPAGAAVVWYNSQYTTLFPYKGYEVRVATAAVEVG